MKVHLFLLVVFFAMIACGGDDKSDLDPGWNNPDPDNSSKISVMSYNIRHCAPYYGTSENTTANVYGIAEVVKKVKPDVVFLQEVDKNTTRSLGIDQARKIAELVGYPNFTFFKMMDYQGGEYGLAILSALPLKEVNTHMIPSVIDGHTITGNNVVGTAKINHAGIDICLAVVHLSVNQIDRDKQVPYVLNNILGNLSIPILCCGDFNATPSNSTMNLFDGAGYVRSNKNPSNFTIPSNEPNREIDYITFKPANSFAVTSHMVMTGLNASDHLPIVSVLNILKP